MQLAIFIGACNAQGLNLTLPDTANPKFVPGTAWMYSIQTDVYIRGDARIVLYTSAIVHKPGSRLDGDRMNLMVILQRGCSGENGNDQEVLLRDNRTWLDPETTMISSSRKGLHKISSWARRENWADSGKVLYLFLSPRDGLDEFLESLRLLGKGSEPFLRVDMRSTKSEDSFQVEFPIYNYQQAQNVACKALQSLPTLE
jgi:hypothetical protein